MYTLCYMYSYLWFCDEGYGRSLKCYICQGLIVSSALMLRYLSSHNHEVQYRETLEMSADLAL